MRIFISLANMCQWPKKAFVVALCLLSIVMKFGVKQVYTSFICLPVLTGEKPVL